MDLKKPVKLIVCKEKYPIQKLPKDFPGKGRVLSLTLDSEAALYTGNCIHIFESFFVSFLSCFC